MKKIIAIILTLLLVFAITGCGESSDTDLDTDSTADVEEEVEDGTTVFHLDSTSTTDTLLVEQALITDVDEEHIIRVYEEDFKDSGYTACLIRFADDDTLGVYMTEGLIEVYCKVVDGQYDGPGEKTVQYTIEDGELVEVE